MPPQYLNTGSVQGIADDGEGGIQAALLQQQLAGPMGDEPADLERWANLSRSRRPFGSQGTIRTPSRR
jgi:hypothetical protein